MNLAASLVECIHAFAETEEMLIGLQCAFIHGLSACIRIGLVIKDFSYFVLYGDAPGVWCHFQLQRRGTQRIAGNLEIDGVEIVFDNHPRLVGNKLLCVALGDTKHLFVAHLYTQVTLRGGVDDLVALAFLRKSSKNDE